MPKTRDYVSEPLTVRERIHNEVMNGCHTGTGMIVMADMLDEIAAGLKFMSEHRDEPTIFDPLVKEVSEIATKIRQL